MDSEMQKNLISLVLLTFKPRKNYPNALAHPSKATTTFDLPLASHDREQHSWVSTFGSSSTVSDIPPDSDDWGGLTTAVSSSFPLSQSQLLNVPS